MSMIDIRLRISGSQLSYPGWIAWSNGKGLRTIASRGKRAQSEHPDSNKSKDCTSSPIIGTLSSSSVNSEGLQLQ